MPSTRRQTRKRTPERAERGPSSTASAAAKKPSVVAVLNSNQDVVRILRDVLEDEGYTVATAGATDAFEVLGTRDNLAPLVESINRIVRPTRR
jgi:hypothetical protein